MPDTTDQPPIERDDGCVDIAPNISYSSVIDPDEAVVYRAEDIGSFRTSDHVVMSDQERFGAWNVATFSRIDNPELFNKRRGLAITGQGNTEWLEYLCESAPTENKPLTELGDN